MKTNADLILDSIDENSGWDHYLILADAFADEGRWKEEEAVRWIAKDRYHPDFIANLWWWWDKEYTKSGYSKESYIDTDIWDREMYSRYKPEKKFGFKYFRDAIHSLIHRYIEVRIDSIEGVLK